MTSMKKFGPWGLGLLAAAVLGLAFSASLAAKDDELKTTAFMGVAVNRIDRAEKAELGLKWGVRVVRVDRKSAADLAGIEEEDILLTFNGEKIRQAFDLTEMVAEHKPGEKIAVELMRDKQKKTVTVTLGERKKRPMLFLDKHSGKIEPPEGPNFHWQEAKRPFLGIGMEMVEGDYGTYFGLKEKTGVVVRSLEEDSPAAKAGLKAGDLLVMVGEQKIENVSDVHKGLGKLKPGDKVDLVVLRRGKSQKFAVILGEHKGPPFFRFFKGEGNWMPDGEKGFRHFFFNGDEEGGLMDLREHMHLNRDDMKENIHIQKKKIDSLKGHITI